jgi:hypothetical protein
MNTDEHREENLSRIKGMEGMGKKDGKRRSLPGEEHPNGQVEPQMDADVHREENLSRIKRMEGMGGKKKV